jgi:hypothetical protein
MAKMITAAEARQVVLTLEGAERFAPAWVASGSRKNVSGFMDAYGFLAKRFAKYLEGRFGEDKIDKETFSRLFTKFLLPFCSPEFLKEHGKSQYRAWKAIERMLNSCMDGMDLSFAIGNGEFVAA